MDDIRTRGRIRSRSPRRSRSRGRDSYGRDYRDSGRDYRDSRGDTRYDSRGDMSDSRHSLQREARVSESKSSCAPGASEPREERRRKRRTGWDVGGGGEPANPADPAAAAAIAAAAASRINSGCGLAPVITPGIVPGRTATTPHPSMCRIYVGSLDYYLTELEIKSVFQAFGTVNSVDMPKEGDRSKGFCFVEYASPEAAQMALSTMHNFVLKGRTIKVGRPTAVGAGQPQQLLTRPMGGFDIPGAGMTTGANMSAITSAQAGAAAATAILAGRSGHTPQGDLAAIIAAGQLSPEKGLDPQGSNRIYVGNVPTGFCSDDLKKIFTCFGTILTCQLLPSQECPHQHRGYGFIEFTTAAAAKLAIDTMNGFEVVGKQLKVNYATALRSGAPGLGLPGCPNLLGVSEVMGGLEGTMGIPAGTGANTIPLGIPVNGVQGTAAPTIASPPSPVFNGPPDAAAVQSPIASSLAGGDAPFPDNPSGIPGSSSVLLLTNTVAPEEVDDDLKEEMREECRRFGPVRNVLVDIAQREVRIFVEFEENAAAAAAAPQLHGRWFGGRQIHVHFYDQEAFEQGILML